MRTSPAAAIAIALAVAALSAPVIAEPEPADRTQVVAFVLAADAPRSTRETLLMAFEAALERERRIEVLDKDLQLVQQAGLVPRDVLGEARGLLRSGEALLRAGKTADALARLSTAEQQLQRVLAHASKQELAQAQFLTGAAYASVGRDADARAAFVRLLTWRPAFSVDDQLEPGAVLPLWEAARAHVAKLPGGTIEVIGRPRSLQAFVDGRFIGFAPTSARRLTVGTHYVTLRATGHQREVRAVEVQADRRTRVAARLEASPRYDRVEALLRAVAPRLGGATIEAAAGELWSLFGVDQAVFLTVAGDRYDAYVYDLHRGRRLSHATVNAVDGDLERAFRRLAEALYADALLDMPAPGEPRDAAATPVARRDDRETRGGRRFYRTWWFWTGAGVVASAIALPLLWPKGSDSLTCPNRHTCGDVVFRF